MICQPTSPSSTLLLSSNVERGTTAVVVWLFLEWRRLCAQLTQLGNRGHAVPSGLSWWLRKLCQWLVRCRRPEVYGSGRAWFPHVRQSASFGIITQFVRSPRVRFLCIGTSRSQLTKSISSSGYWEFQKSKNSTSLTSWSCGIQPPYPVQNPSV